MAMLTLIQCAIADRAIWMTRFRGPAETRHRRMTIAKRDDASPGWMDDERLRACARACVGNVVNRENSERAGSAEMRLLARSLARSDEDDSPERVQSP